MKLKTTIAGLVLAFLVAAPAMAQQSAVHFSGNSWETGAFPPSNPGDLFEVVGIVTQIDAPLYWQPWVYEFTIHMWDLVSSGGTVFGTTHVVPYQGGFLAVYRDSLPASADYGVNPPNATAPSTFTDGDGVYINAFFTDFTLTFNTTTAGGSFTGNLMVTGGIVYPNLTDPLAWTLGSDIAGFSPIGYDLELNGVLYPNGPVSVDEMSWGGIKGLYR